VEHTGKSSWMFSLISSGVRTLMPEIKVLLLTVLTLQMNQNKKYCNPNPQIKVQIPMLSVFLEFFYGYCPIIICDQWPVYRKHLLAHSFIHVHGFQSLMVICQPKFSNQNTGIWSGDIAC